MAGKLAGAWQVPAALKAVTSRRLWAGKLANFQQCIHHITMNGTTTRAAQQLLASSSNAVTSGKEDSWLAQQSCHLSCEIISPRLQAGLKPHS